MTDLKAADVEYRYDQSAVAQKLVETARACKWRPKLLVIVKFAADEFTRQLNKSNQKFALQNSRFKTMNF